MLAAILAVIATIIGPSTAVAQYAAEVISYSTGTTPTVGFTTASAALGEPERYTGEGAFPGVVSPFNPPYLSSEIVSVGEGGELTLRLSHYAIPQPGVLPEIGLFSNFGLIDVAYPNGQAGTPAGGFGPPDNAIVSVSADGVSWFSLGSTTLDLPANGYTELSDPYSSAAGSVPSDFQQPFAGNLSSFDGLPYSHTTSFDMLDLLAGSGGGKWLDISSSGLPQVGFIRFSLTDDGLPGTSLNFELDAVSISHAALGGPTVPEPATIALAAAVAIATGFTRPRRSRRPCAATAKSVPRPARPRARRTELANLHQKRTRC
jgi:hypothetical protein